MLFFLNSNSRPRCDKPNDLDKFRRRLLEKAISYLSQVYFTIQKLIAKILFWAFGQSNPPKGRMRQNFFKIAREANLILAARQVCAIPQKQWAALSAAHQIRSEKSQSLMLVGIYDQARTFFQNSA